MAPGRKRGAKGVKTTSGLNLGDLVLAKVKGFPAWPAKISRPEDWDRTADPKKYFVQFFGTEEIAFVAPSDIQAFTIEAKNKLSARCQGKTVKYFAQAVKEICEEFEELKRKISNGLTDDTDKSALESDGPLVDRVTNDAMELDLENDHSPSEPHEETEVKGLADHGLELERCSQQQDSTEYEDVKPKISRDSNTGSSPVITSRIRNKISSDGSNLVKKDAVLASSPSNHYSTKEEFSSDNYEDKKSCLPKSEGGMSVHEKHSDGSRKEISNGTRPKKMGIGSKKKSESEVHKVGTLATDMSCNSSDDHVDPSGSVENLKDRAYPTALSDGKKQSFQSVSKEKDDAIHGKKAPKLVKDKKHVEVASNLRKDVDDCPEAHAHLEVSSRRKIQLGHGHKVSRQTNRKIGFCIPNVLDKKVGDAEVKGSASRVKVGNRLESWLQTGNVGSVVLDDEGVLPPAKRHRQALEVMSVSSISSSDDKLVKGSASKNDMPCSDNVKSPSVQSQTKRRAVRICDDDEPKTPVHGGSTIKVCASHLMDSVNSSDVRSESVVHDQPEAILSIECNLQQNVEKRPRKTIIAHALGSPGKVESEKLSSKVAKPIFVSPKRSPELVSSTKPVMESHKVNKSSAKVSISVAPKKAQAGSKGSGAVSDIHNHNHNQATDENDKPDTLLERPKTTPKSISRINDSSSVVGSASENDFVLGERLEVGKDVLSSYVDSKTSESAVSMKHLIAAAQAKRRQTQSQSYSHGNHDSVLVAAIDSAGKSPSLALPIPSFPIVSVNMTQSDVQQYYTRQSLSPSSQGCQFSSSNQPVTEEFEETRVSLGQQPAWCSLSGGTEAAVARDAFEGMIETLSRTKESIGRATRLAIDCAKYGIANEVVELLIRKLEIEPSFHRKVDLFFLVDSITQCSHSHKGIAGASYIPIVEASLPRMLGAAAPPGSSGRENRRQCLKVLGLWLERKILPDSLLRRCMDDIGASNDDTSIGVFLKRPSRSERSVDDPIREMEGMLVDEYGSNVTFQLPGLPSRIFDEEEEEEEDIPSSSGNDGGDTSTLEPTPVSGPENCTVTPNDRRHRILEEVDGELEMEDVSGHPKDERQFFAGGSVENCMVTPNEKRHRILEDVDFELEMEDASGHGKDERELFAGGCVEITSQQPGSHRILEVASNNSSKLPPLPEGSPPLPLASPSPTPPLPSSPPPPSPTPPPPSSPSPPPPPPPPLPSLPYPLPPPQVGLPLSLPTQRPLPPPTSLASQQAHPLPSSVPSSSPKLMYQQPPMQHEYCGTPSGSQLVQVASDTPNVAHVDAAVRSEVLPYKTTCYGTAGVCNSLEPSGFNSSRPLEYGHSDIYSNPQASMRNEQYQYGNTTFTHRPLGPALSSQNSSGHFSYPKPMLQQHTYPPPYSLPHPFDAARRYVADEQWRMAASDFNTDHQLGMWMSGGWSSTCSGPSFGQEGYYRPHFERPPTNNVGFQPSAPNMLPSGAPVPGHGVSQMMPCRPDMPSLNCWRPA